MMSMSLAGYAGLFRRFILRDLFREKVRASLTLIGIALGVAVMLAIDLANYTVLTEFRSSVDVVAGKANLEIRPTTLPILDESVIESLEPYWGEDVLLTPVIDQTALWPYVPGEGDNDYETGETVQVLGADMLVDQAFRSYSWSFQQKPNDFLDIFQANAVFVGASFARRHGLKRGDTFPLMVNDSTQTFRVVGVLGEGGLSEAYGGDLVLMDIASAQSALRMEGRLSRVELLVPEGQEALMAEALNETLSETMPGTVKVQRPETRGEQVDKMLGAFQANLTALSFIALLVGMFLIYNTMSITVLRRRVEIGTLRTLGVSRWGIGALFLGEVLLLGAAGSLLGVGLGWAMAGGAVDSVSQTVETLYTGHSVSGVLLAPWKMGAAFVVGILLTAVGAFVPVWESLQVSPAEAARRATFERRVMGNRGVLALVGLGLLVVAVMMAFQPLIGKLPVFGYGAALLSVFGSALVLPWVLYGLLGGLAQGMRKLVALHGNPMIHVAVNQLSGALGRTSVAVASLMIGIALMVSLAVMIGSFRDTVRVWINQTVRADLWIRPASRFNSRQTGTIPRVVVDRLKTVPGVAAVDAFIEHPIEYEGEPANIAAGDMAVSAQYGELLFVDGEPTSEVMKRLTDGDGVILTESFALHHGLEKGDPLTLNTPIGPVTWTIEGVYYDYSSERGYAVLPLKAYETTFGKVPYSGAAIYAKPDVDTEELRLALHQVAGQDSVLRITTTGEVRDEVFRVFDATFAITYALHMVAIGVALLGVMNTLFTLVMECRREFGILKYLGADKPHIRSMVMVQAGLLGVLGSLAGLILGLILSILLIFVINRQSFGWTVQFAIPWLFLLQSFVLIMATAFISGIVPARLAARTVAPEVIRIE